MKNTEELKTLKDLHKIHSAVGYEEEGSDWVNLKGLKAEAIKWVKRWQKNSWTQNPESAEAFMDFFNISEEDLK